MHALARLDKRRLSVVTLAVAMLALLAALSNVTVSAQEGTPQDNGAQNGDQQQEGNQEQDASDREQEGNQEQDGEQQEGNQEQDASDRQMQLSGADVRVLLNRLLQEHVYLTLAATEEIIEGEFTEEGVTEFRGAMITLDKENTMKMADLVGQVYGEDVQDMFVELWRNQIAYFFDYAHGVAGDGYPEDHDLSDERKMEIARESLEHAIDEVIDLISTANLALNEETVRDTLNGHVESMLDAIDAQAAEDANEYQAVHQAAHLAGEAADALAQAVVEAFPDMVDKGRDDKNKDQPTIVEIAAGDNRFETLVTALEAADLVETLSGEGPYTVFAPTDDAFDALPEGTLDDLLGDTEALTDVLLYHVLEGEVESDEVVELESATTLSGEDVSISVEDGNVFVNDAQVIVTDIKASNGVIHAIDAVLTPPSE